MNSELRIANHQKLLTMIPIHDAADILAKKIKVNRLSTLNEYDIHQPHRHHYFEFFVFERGGGTHLIDFQHFDIHANAIHIVAPGQVHQVNRALDSSGYVLLFGLDALAAFPLVSDFLFDHICFGNEERSPCYLFQEEDIAREIIGIIKNIWSNIQRKTNHIQHYTTAGLVQMCIHCINNLQINTNETAHKNQQHYRQFRQLLKNNFKKLKKVKDYAAALHLSEKHLNEISLAASGLNASTLLYNQIILEAKRLLMTGITAKETAYELDFEDPAHFSKFFKTQTGISPSDFQKIQV